MERAALTLRGVERALGLDRRTISAAIKSGELPATRIGKRNLLILRSDVESWLRRHALCPNAHAEARVEQLLARESRRVG